VGVLIIIWYCLREDGYMIAKYPDGKIVKVLKASESSIEEWQKLNEWDVEVLKLIDRFLDRDMAYVDIGSGQGETFLYAMSVSKRALAIEPDPEKFAILLKNVKANMGFWSRLAFGRFSVQNLCVMPTNKKGAEMVATPWKLDFSELHVKKVIQNGTNLIEYAQQKSQKAEDVEDVKKFQVDCRTLPTIIAEWGLSDTYPVFVRLNLDGIEVDVLPELLNWLDNRYEKPTFSVKLSERTIKADIETKWAILQFVKRFLYCGKTLEEWEPCATIRESWFSYPFELYLSDVRP